MARQIETQAVRGILRKEPAAFTSGSSGASGAAVTLSGPGGTQRAVVFQAVISADNGAAAGAVYLRSGATRVHGIFFDANEVKTHVLDFSFPGWALTTGDSLVYENTTEFDSLNISVVYRIDETA